MKRLAIPPAAWWDSIPEAFELELAHPTQVQVRLDAGFASLVFRSHFSSLRIRCYNLLSEQSLSFAVASGCERISRRHPEDAWLLKLAISGVEPHAKLYLDRRMSLDEMEMIAADLGLSVRATVDATAALLGATGAERLRCISVAPGNPVRLELYASRAVEPDGIPTTLDALGGLTRLTYDESFQALSEIHPTLCGHGRQRYSIGVDGRGVREGLKVGYADVRAEAVEQAVESLTPAPAIALRRLHVASGVLSQDALDHLSVRFRPERPVHVTVYYNRTWAAVA